MLYTKITNIENCLQLVVNIFLAYREKDIMWAYSAAKNSGVFYIGRLVEPVMRLR